MEDGNVLGGRDSNGGADPRSGIAPSGIDLRGSNGDDLDQLGRKPVTWTYVGETEILRQAAARALEEYDRCMLAWPFKIAMDNLRAALERKP